MNEFDWLSAGFQHFSITLIRYLIFAGGAYALFWVVLPKLIRHRRIQHRPPKSRILRNEIKYSLITCVIFAAAGVLSFAMIHAGWTPFYRGIEPRGWGYFVFSIMATIVFHDAYFYFTHRAMHHPKLFKHIHAVHHRSINPSPWTSYSFHPWEAGVQALILPLVVLLIPMNLAALTVFLTYTIALNVLGHLGYELFPRGWTRSRWTFWHNTSTHHNMHHQYFNCNYSLYFNWWDRVFGTNHPKYHERFEEIKARPRVDAEGGSGALSPAPEPRR